MPTKHTKHTNQSRSLFGFVCFVCFVGTSPPSGNVHGPTDVPMEVRVS